MMLDIGRYVFVVRKSIGQRSITGMGKIVVPDPMSRGTP
jgi:hypothetical protein